MTKRALAVTHGLIVVVAAGALGLVRQRESQAANRLPIKVGVLGRKIELEQ